MIQAGSDNASQACNADDEEGVGVDSAAAKIALKNVGSDEQGGGNHQAKSGQVQRAEVKVRDHL